MPKVTGTTMTPDQALVRLMTWLSPAFPVGAFTYSHGTEYAVETGAVKDAATLIDWVRGILSWGAGRNDAILLSLTHKGVSAGDFGAVLEVARWAAAMRGSKELALESEAQGTMFFKTVADVWPDPTLETIRSDLKAADIAPTYPVAVGVVAGLAGVPLNAALAAYLQAMTANLVSAAVRLVPLGQTDGQRATAALENCVLETAAAVENATLDDLGGSALGVDLASMQHETQYTRLFRS